MHLKILVNLWVITNTRSHLRKLTMVNLLNYKMPGSLIVGCSDVARGQDSRVYGAGVNFCNFFNWYILGS